MKKYTKNPFLLPALIAGLGLLPAGRVPAQTFTILHSFTAFSFCCPPGTSNNDGANPQAGLILSGNTLYGTAYWGGTAGGGTMFAVKTDGSGFTNLHSCGSFPSDASGPRAELITNSSGNILHGTTQGGGSSGHGTVFAVNTNGTGFTNLYSFTAIPFPSSDFPTNSDGANPVAGLILSGSTLYGTAERGGSGGRGTVFAVNTDGTGFTNLYSFTAGSGSYFDVTNSDGAYPVAGLVLSGNTLYGTAARGGSGGRGTVFAVNTDGTGFTILYSFTWTSDPYGSSSNSDGAFPYAGLILSGNTLYGTAGGGGSGGRGTVFALNTDGTGFTNLHSFGSFPGDGAIPYGGLILSGNTLYGTTAGGGSFLANGTVFTLNTDGTGFTILYSFTGQILGMPNPLGGFDPRAGLIISGNTLYGTTARGGNPGLGTVFSLSFAPQVTILPSGANVILTWPTHYAGFDYTGYTLQSTTNLDSPAVWSTVSPGPVVVSGQNTVTNPISGPQQFYRLSQ